MSNIDKDIEYCIKVEMQTLYPEEYEKIYGNLDENSLLKPSINIKDMPRKIFTLVSKEDHFKKIELTSLSYDLALEEALSILDSSYKQHVKDQEFNDEHITNVFMFNAQKKLNELGWSMYESCDDVYKNILYEDEHMMSFSSQNSQNKKEI